jgi:sulfur-carrier protein adenylyltransferase/sulfurtransferase
VKSETEPLSAAELARYNRHIILPQFGLEGQKKLKAARVLVIGTGGLASPLLLYLAAAGVGTLGIVDFDLVDESNLQRQVLFDVGNVGGAKVDAARRRLKDLNPYIEIQPFNEHINSENAFRLIQPYEIVVDCTDNFPARYLLNDACVLLGKPLIYGSIFQFDGQVAVFNSVDNDGLPTANYRCLYPTPPPPDVVPNCDEGGVLGVLPGIIGSLQALEVTKLITGIGEPLVNKLLLFNALSLETRILTLSHDENNPLNGKNPTQTDLIDYDAFCGVPSTLVTKELSSKELKAWKDSGKDFQLIDVREPEEFALVNLGGELIPVGEIETNLPRIARDKPVVLYCKSGVRSGKVAELLQSRHGLDNIYTLRGGILAYAREVDPTLPTY